MGNHKEYGKYGKAVILAVKLFKKERTLTPKKAWEKAVYEIFETESSRKKGCPKTIFLGLCELGYVEGVERGDYTKSVKNRRYLEEAIEVIKKNRGKCKYSKKELWMKVMDNLGMKKSHNQQMDVVLALYHKNMLVL